MLPIVRGPDRNTHQFHSVFFILLNFPFATQIASWKLTSINHDRGNWPIFHADQWRPKWICSVNWQMSTNRWVRIRDRPTRFHWRDSRFFVWWSRLRDCGKRSPKFWRRRLIAQLNDKHQCQRTKGGGEQTLIGISSRDAGLRPNALLPNRVGYSIKNCARTHK